jgi:protein-S-isoprenylcysteine O-methyltransferase Ste14
MGQIQIEKKIMPTTWFLGFLGATIAAGILLPLRHVIPFPYNHLGWIPVIIGVVLNLWTDNLFKKQDTTVKPYLKPTRFICYGPFCVSRNPMYLGMLIILIGTAVLFKSVLLTIPALLYLLIMQVFYIRKEEAFLIEQFGDEFLQYKKKVRQWI